MSSTEGPRARSEHLAAERRRRLDEQRARRAGAANAGDRGEAAYAGEALRAFALEKDYGDSPALYPLDLTVGRGEVVALVGHNGSGKSTLLKMCSGLLTPTSGSVRIGEHPAGSIGARAAMSYLADTPSFYDDLSVWEHLEYVARLHGVATWEQNAADLLGFLGIYDRADELPLRFSRGLRQKAAICIALVRPFELLLVDEPFVGLDAAGRSALVELIEQNHDAGATIIVATHELSFTALATRMIVLADGTVVHDGEPDGDIAARHLG